jgi:hypothetical protein
MQFTRCITQKILLVSIMAISPGYAFADRVGYSEVFDCKAETPLFSATHHHDWSSKTHDARWQMISTDENPFTEANTYANLRVVERATGKLVFQVPTPALRYLWVSPDNKFVVGISNIKLWNPIQVVVFNIAGKCLLKQKVVASTFEGVTTSVSNYVTWYREPSPKIRLDQRNGSIHLFIESNSGPTRVFEFKDVP